MKFDTEAFRKCFPILQRKEQNQSIVFLDGPAGTQVPIQVTDAISSYYHRSAANTHGAFVTSIETDEMIASLRNTSAAFLGASSAECISFGANMTSLNFALSNAFRSMLQAGDEIVISQACHEANRQPWLEWERQGIQVKEIQMLPDGSLDYEDAERKITSRTKLCAVGASSNITGCVHDLSLLRSITKTKGALLSVDAVHFAPHFPIDVQALDCDFLLCSAYKFYGPHIGILYSKAGLLDQLNPQRLRTQDQQAPYRIETGTLNHASLAGTGAAIDFISDWGSGQDLRNRLVSAMESIQSHERSLFEKLYHGVSEISTCHIFGPSLDAMRSPTLSFYHDTLVADEIARLLSQEQIQVWSGHFYAIRAIEVTGLIERGGVVRMGLSGYSSAEDIDRTLSILGQLGK